MENRLTSNLAVLLMLCQFASSALYGYFPDSGVSIGHPVPTDATNNIMHVMQSLSQTSDPTSSSSQNPTYSHITPQAHSISHSQSQQCELPNQKKDLQKLANRGMEMLQELLGQIMTCDPGSNGAKPVQKSLSRHGISEVISFVTPRYAYRFLMADRYQMRQVRKRLWGIVRGLGRIFNKIKRDYIGKNVVKGSRNTVIGQDNFVVGNENHFGGSSNWIFASQLSAKSPLDGVLVINNYLVELADLLQSDARILNSISCSDFEENMARAHKWWKLTRQEHRFTV